MTVNEISEVEKRIGHVFKNKALLERAFTHSSASRDALFNYESLEFLGDSILDFVVAKKLMEENPDAHEGALTHRRAEIVSQEPLERSIDELGLAEFLKVGKGESIAHITEHTKVKSNMFEAIVGALYYDAGMDAAEAFITKALKSRFDGSAKHDGDGDYKTILNEYTSKRHIEVRYKTTSVTGPSHEPEFQVEVLLEGTVAGVGRGKSKKAAEQSAARQAVTALGASE